MVPMIARGDTTSPTRPGLRQRPDAYTQCRLQRRERQQHSAMAGAGSLCFRTITRAPSRSDLQLFSHDRPFAGSGTRLLTRRVMTSAASRVRWRVCVAMYRVCRWLKSYSILDTRLVYDRRRPMVAIHSFSNHQVMTTIRPPAVCGKIQQPLGAWCINHVARDHRAHEPRTRSIILSRT